VDKSAWEVITLLFEDQVCIQSIVVAYISCMAFDQPDICPPGNGNSGNTQIRWHHLWGVSILLLVVG